MLKCSKAKLFRANQVMHIHRVCYASYTQDNPVLCAKRLALEDGLLVVNDSISQYKLANAS